jgi:hypothetical protein
LEGRKEEGERRKEEGGRRKEKGGRRKNGRRKEEGGRKKEGERRKEVGQARRDLATIISFLGMAFIFDLRGYIGSKKIMSGTGNSGST